MSNLEKFGEELERIEDEKTRELTVECLLNAPLYFWYKPASSTGKYHSEDENGQGGLIVHTKRVCKSGEHLMDAWLKPFKADVIRSSDILHDIKKYGNGMSGGTWTVKNHPELGADFILEINKKVQCLNGPEIAEAVRTHMGKWGNPKPQTEEQIIVHLADYLGTKFYEEPK